MTGTELLKKPNKFIARLSPANPAPETLLLAGAADVAPSGIFFAKKKKRKAPAKPPARAVAASKTAPKAAPKKAKRKLPTQEPKKKRSASGAVRAERFFSNLSVSLTGQGYGRADYARLGILGAAMLVILYYAFSAGGYFVSQRSYGELWILYLVVLGLLFSLQVRGGMPRLGWAEVGIFGAFTLWNLASVAWSYNPSDSFNEFVRALLYLSGFGLFYIYLSKREWLSWLGHLFVGIAVIVAIRALLGKVVPDIVNDPDPFGQNRLNYPITYWNTLAVFMGMAFVIGLRVLADRGSRSITRYIYAPALSLFLVVIFFTVSRAGIALLAAAIGVYLLTSVNRLRAVLQTAMAFFWMGVVVAISYKWLPAMLATQPSDADRTSQGHLLGLLMILMFVLAAATQWGLIKLEGRIKISQELGRRIGIAMAVAGAVVIFGGFLGYTSVGGRGGPVNWTQNRISSFTASTKSTTTASVEERLSSSQSERWQEWMAAVETFKEHPLTGTGAATWVIGWNKWRPFDMISKDGHSWFFENISELGILGGGLMAAFVAVFLIGSIRDIRFLKKGRQREILGAFFAASLMLLVHAMIDWDWEMPVIFLSFFMFAGAMLRYGQLSRSAAERDGGDPPPASATRSDVGWSPRNLIGWYGAVGVVALLAMAVTIPPMLASNRMDKVMDFERKGDSVNEEQAALSAQRFNPLSGDALVYQARAQYRLGKLDGAEQLFLQALEKNPKNDKTWRMLAHVYLDKKEVDQAVEADQISRQLNPLETTDTAPLEEAIRKAGGFLWFHYIPGGIDDSTYRPTTVVDYFPQIPHDSVQP
ncbi:MAG: O-antigen ligase family protein [Actinobacteria bacterium]|nr:O-antigen ligase family protein [Actinomycetota bacterium]MCL5883323.1 O-antigen ligase family protein [Actinomycetota bacterium]